MLNDLYIIYVKFYCNDGVRFDFGRKLMDYMVKLIMEFYFWWILKGDKSLYFVV